jgi:hypothetical protein
MYSPSDFARGKGYWHFDSVLRLPSEATTPMEGLQAVCTEFAAIAGRQLGWGGSRLLETSANSYTYTIGSKRSISLMAFWSETWGYASCTISTRDRIFALEIERITQQFLPKITPEELLANRSLALLSDSEILMLGHMIEWGDAYSPELSKILCEAWKTRSDELKCELAFCFYGSVTYWRDFYPLLKDSLKAGLHDLLEMSVQSAIDMMEFDMRLEGQSED